MQSGDTYGDDLWANVNLATKSSRSLQRTYRKGRTFCYQNSALRRPVGFDVLPARGFAMYAPEIHGRSSEFRLQIQDRK